MKSNPRKLRLALASVVVLVALFGTLAHLRVKRAVNHYKAQLIAQGEKLEVRDLEPVRPDPADNGFAEMSRLSGALSGAAGARGVAPPALRGVAPGRAMAVMSLTNWKSEFGSNGTNVTWADLESQLEQSAQLVAELRDVLRKPVLGANLDYSLGFELPLPHLARFKNASQTLLAAAMSDLHAHRPEAAAANVEAVLGVVQGMEPEPLLISQLVRIAIAHIALGGTWQVLQAPRVDDARLGALQRRWETVEFIDASRRAIEMERAMQLNSIRVYRQSRAKFMASLDAWSTFMGGAPPAGTNFSDVLAEMPERTLKGLGYLVWRWYWSYTDQLRMLQIEQSILDALHAVNAGTPFAVAQSNLVVELAPFQSGEARNDEDDASFWSRASQNRMATMLSDAAFVFERAPSKVMNIETARVIALTAIAVKRFQQQRGRAPEALSELVPELISRVPTDPMDGRPLRYRRDRNGGFLLYSIGEDFKDDAGDPSNAKSTAGSSYSWLRGRDWVWPLPASVEEVREFNAEQEKKRRR